MDLLSTIGLLAVVFAVSLTVSYLVSLLKAKRRASINIRENCKVRMVGAGGAYRCFFLREDIRGLVFSTPLQRDRYVPLRVGDSMIVQVPGEHGLTTFCSEILERSTETHELVLKHPSTVRRIDRRSEERDRSCEGAEATINGAASHLVDLSAGGLKAVLTKSVKPGEAVAVKLPLGLGAVDGWVLESVPSALEGRSAREIRVQFQRPLAGLTGRNRPQNGRPSIH